jgi:hypothetical protein
MEQSLKTEPEATATAQRLDMDFASLRFYSLSKIVPLSPNSMEEALNLQRAMLYCSSIEQSLIFLP